MTSIFDRDGDNEGVTPADALGDVHAVPEAPKPKYTVIVRITGNSRSEIEDRVYGLGINWAYEYGTRDEIDSTDGTTSIRMRHTNPEQTPEAYREQLSAYVDARRRARKEVTR